MRNPNTSFCYLICAAIAVAAISFSGCKPITIAKSQEIVIPPGSPQYVVQMKGEGWKKNSVIKAALTDGMTIDDVLDSSKAKQKFRNMEIQIVRRVPESGSFVKLPVDYRAKNKKVPVEQNYSIHADDQIVIRQVVETPMDQFVDSMFPGRGK